MAENASPGAVPAWPEEVLDRTAQRALRRYQETYTDEVRRLLDAGLEVMSQFGTTRSPRVADIIEHAGMSRDAFYRHFASKEDLVAAIVEVGAWRLVGYLDHQMGKVTLPEEKLYQWIRGVMAQAMDPDVARTTRAVLWNGGRVPDATESFDSVTVASELLIEPLTRLSARDPRRDALTVSAAVMGRMRAALRQGTTPSDDDVEHLFQFCRAALGDPAIPKANPTRRTL